MRVVMRAMSKSLMIGIRRSTSSCEAGRSTSRSVSILGSTLMLHISPPRPCGHSAGRNENGEPGRSGLPASYRDPDRGLYAAIRDVSDRLLGGGLVVLAIHLIGGRHDGHIGSVVTLGGELHGAVGGGEQGVVTT